MSAGTDDAVKPRADTRIALANASIIAGMISVVGVISVVVGRRAMAGPDGFTSGSGYGLALIVGLISAFVVWLVLYFAVVRPLAPSRVLSHLAVLLGVSTLAALGPYGLASTIWTATRQGPTTQITMGPQGERVTYWSGRPPVQIKELVETYRDRAETERAAAESARRDIFGAGLVQAYNLEGGGSLDDMRSQLSMVRTTTTQAFARQQALLAELEVSAGAIQDQGARRRAMAWVANERKFRTQRLNALQSRLDESFDVTEEMIDLLARQEGAWKVQNGRIEFREQAHLDEMTRHVVRLDQLTAEIDQMEGDFEREAAG